MSEEEHPAKPAREKLPTDEIVRVAKPLKLSRELLRDTAALLYHDYAKKIVPSYVNRKDDPALAAALYQKIELQASEFYKQSLGERVKFMKVALELAKPTDRKQEAKVTPTSDAADAVTNRPNDAFTTAKELIESVRIVQNVRNGQFLLEKAAGCNAQWLAAANALPAKLKAAEQLIRPLLPQIEKATTGTIECGHLSAKTGFELALQLAAHVEWCLLHVFYTSELIAGRMDPGLSTDEKTQRVRGLVRERSPLQQADAERAAEFLADIPMPTLVEWNRLGAQLEREAQSVGVAGNHESDLDMSDFSNDLTATSRSVLVARACNAWESGWSLIVEILDEALAKRAEDDNEFVTLRTEFAELKEKNAQPSQGDKEAELTKALADFRRYYRQVELYCDGLPDAETTEPWDCGCLRVCQTARVFRGLVGNVEVITYKDLSLGADVWRENVLFPMQQHAVEWRRRFESLKRVAEPRQAHSTTAEDALEAADARLGDAADSGLGHKYMFSRSGASFRVRFDREQGDIPTRLNGAWFVYWLLQSPHKSFDSTQLRQKLVEHRLGEARAADGTGTDSDAAESIEYLKRGATDIAKQIEQARKDKDQSKVDRLLDELEQVKERIKGLQGKDRKPRTEGSSSDRVSVTNAINLVQKNCSKEWGMPKLAKHLDYISKGKTIAYQPQGDAPDWQF